MPTSIQETRYRNMVALYKRFCAMHPNEPERGMLRRFGQYVGVNPRYLSHIRNGRKAIGHNIARKFEVAFGKPESWMDVSHGEIEGATNGEHEYLMRALIAHRINPAAAEAALSIVEMAVGGIEKPDKDV